MELHQPDGIGDLEEVGLCSLPFYPLSFCNCCPTDSMAIGTWPRKAWDCCGVSGVSGEDVADSELSDLGLLVTTRQLPQETLLLYGMLREVDYCCFFLLLLLLLVCTGRCLLRLISLSGTDCSESSSKRTPLGLPVP